MTTEMKKALIVYLSVLLMILFAGFAGADQTKAEIEAENPYMTEAINEALDGIRNGHGGPFGCVIVKDGEIVGRGHNMVLNDKDSTAHGEITAIRDAEQALDSYDLSGCILYTTGEPCPMCLYAILCQPRGSDRRYHSGSLRADRRNRHQSGCLYPHQCGYSRRAEGCENPRGRGASLGYSSA